MDLAPLITALKSLGSWHALALALTLLPVAVAVVLYEWAPSTAGLTLACGLAVASGLAPGGALRWCAETALPRWHAGRVEAAEDAALVKQLSFVGTEEFGILGAFLASGRREHSLDVANPVVRELRDRGLLVWTGPTSHRVPDAIWREMEARPAEFPPGKLPKPRPEGWMSA